MLTSNDLHLSDGNECGLLMIYIYQAGVMLSSHYLHLSGWSDVVMLTSNDLHLSGGSEC